MNCINAPTIYILISLLLRLALYLFNSFCMNLYNCQMWRFNNEKHLEVIHVAWVKCIRRIWNINSKTHQILLHNINSCLPIG